MSVGPFVILAGVVMFVTRLIGVHAGVGLFVVPLDGVGVCVGMGLVLALHLLSDLLVFVLTHSSWCLVSVLGLAFVIVINIIPVLVLAYSLVDLLALME